MANRFKKVIETFISSDKQPMYLANLLMSP